MPDRIKTITGGQIRAGRALARLTIEELASLARVGVQTIRRAEAVDGPVSLLPNNSSAIRAALEASGVEFIPENGGGAGVRATKR